MKLITSGFGGGNLIVQGYLGIVDDDGDPIDPPNLDPPPVIEPTGPQVVTNVLVGASDLQYIYNGSAITRVIGQEYLRKIKERDSFSWSERLADRFDDVDYYT